MIEDSYEFDVPEEIREWIESNSKFKSAFLGLYTFKNGKIEASDSIEAMRWWSENPDACQVDQTEVDDAGVSTVFLFIDHGFGFDLGSRPVLFETMVFGGDFNGYKRRYCTIGEAKQGHWETVDGLKTGALEN